MNNKVVFAIETQKFRPKGYLSKAKSFRQQLFGKSSVYSGLKRRDMKRQFTAKSVN
jgi:hypothetical protein